LKPNSPKTGFWYPAHGGLRISSRIGREIHSPKSIGPGLRPVGTGAGPGARSVAGRLFQIQGISAGVANKFCSGALRINNNAIVGLFRVCISRSSERTRARSLWGDTSLIWSSVTSLCFRSCTGVSSSMFRHSSNAHSRSLVVSPQSPGVFHRCILCILIAKLMLLHPV
jgi:hypothetical protein